MKPNYITVAFAILFAAKISAQPVLEWQVNLHRPDYSNIYVKDLKTDPNGNVYLLSSAYETGPILTKYDSSGDLLWKYHFRFQDWHYPTVSPILILHNGNIAIFISHIIAHYSGGDRHKTKYYVSCYILSCSGTLLHSNSSINFRYDGSGIPAAITKDQRLLVASGSEHAEVCELDSTAHFINGKIFYPFSWHDHVDIFDLTVDSSNAVILSGLRSGYPFAGDTGFVMKLDENFKVEWTTKVLGMEAWRVKADQQGNIFTQGTNYDHGIAQTMIKLSPKGKILWKNVLLNGILLNPQGREFLIDSIGNVLCIVNSDYYSNPTRIVKLDPNGNTIWSQTFVTDSLFSYVAQITLLPNNHILAIGSKNIYYVGYFSNAVGIIQELNEYGNLVWSIYYPYDGNKFRDFSPKAMTRNDNNTLYVCNYDASGVHYYFDTTKLELQKFRFSYQMKSTLTSAIMAPTIAIYPNPFSQEAKLDWTLPTSSEAEINLADMNSRTIRNIISGNFDEGEHHTILYGNDLLPGIYLLELSSKEGTITKKIVVSPTSQ